MPSDRTGDNTAPDTTPLDTVRDRPGGRSARVRSAVLSTARAQLMEGGYGSLSHRTVAQRAGVDPATVYRRWPTRARLALDALLGLADAIVPVPDTGELLLDLRAFVSSVGAMLEDQAFVRVFQALCAAQADDPELRSAASDFWQIRYAKAAPMIHRAAERGEAVPPVEPALILEQAVAPLYFRALITGQTIDPEFRERCVSRALVGWQGP